MTIDKRIHNIEIKINNLEKNSKNSIKNIDSSSLIRKIEKIKTDICVLFSKLDEIESKIELDKYNDDKSRDRRNK